MFTFTVQLLDAAYYGVFGLFLFYFAMVWAIHISKLLRSALYTPHSRPESDWEFPSVSIIIPVYNEKEETWRRVLQRMQRAMAGLNGEIIVVANGSASKINADTARSLGLATIFVKEAGKRNAIALGAKRATMEISVILDSDTLVSKTALLNLLNVFNDPFVGGATPRHVIFERRPAMRRISNWLEDNRFMEVVRSQTISGAVSCLPGRLFAIRTDQLKAAAPYLVSERFLGLRCVSGDDRFLTSWLLKYGMKTVYQGSSLVFTDAPTTLGEFVRQRLRWSRGSMRGTILSLPWLWRYPYTCIIVITNVAMRWVLLFILFNVFVLHLVPAGPGLRIREVFPHLDSALILVCALVLGLFLGGLAKNFRHLYFHPRDILFYPFYLMVATLVLTPLEYYGNLTCWKQGWLTRDVERVTWLELLKRRMGWH